MMIPDTSDATSTPPTTSLPSPVALPVALNCQRCPLPPPNTPANSDDERLEAPQSPGLYIAAHDDPTDLNASPPPTQRTSYPPLVSILRHNSRWEARTPSPMPPHDLPLPAVPEQEGAVHEPDLWRPVGLQNNLLLMDPTSVPLAPQEWSFATSAPRRIYPSHSASTGLRLDLTAGGDWDIDNFLASTQAPGSESSLPEARFNLAIPRGWRSWSWGMYNTEFIQCLWLLNLRYKVEHMHITSLDILTLDNFGSVPLVAGLLCMTRPAHLSVCHHNRRTSEGDNSLLFVNQFLARVVDETQRNAHLGFVLTQWLRQVDIYVTTVDDLWRLSQFMAHSD
ncbi:hypothetical protein L227DRAFT_600701 [Lentinus tigrinus ALCF2SS1-6]|uniref:Uncharacterized protein n=1 Tax=Lentinus tigrinus ALCF2SS1-6 TaxID=1328759 RepID=A0A5C2SC76_9APHY|nr:hypothetical protein L227DRAFT_600701 [Lentinus tigrinus ALCF2SS1-6]